MLSMEKRALVIALVKDTKGLILREMRQEKVMEKGAADYVTNVDFAVQEFVKKKLARLFPEIPLIAEEKENTGLRREGTYWILDPIDGTTNLVYDYHFSAVSLGLYEKGEITFGVVYNPFREELFQAAKGEGARLNGIPIHVAGTRRLGDAVVSFGSSPYEKGRAKDFFPLYYRIFMECADFRRTGSAALDMCYVACGRQHAYLEATLKPWDYAAGTVILREAGGLVTDWKGEEPPYLDKSGILAGAPQFMDRLLALIGESGCKQEGYSFL